MSEHFDKITSRRHAALLVGIHAYIDPHPYSSACGAG